MSSRTLRQLLTTPTKHGSRPCTLASPGQSILTFNLLSVPGLSSTKQRGATHHQTRLFHHTPARRLFESPDHIIAVCFGVASGILLQRFFPWSSLFKRAAARPTSSPGAPSSDTSSPVIIPPISWQLTTDQKTADDVEAIISAGFEMARKAPAQRREQAFREASFQVPHEIARLNPEAPRFRVEDMGPMPPLKKTWKEMGEIGFHLTPPFDPEKEARVFLYFPNDAPRATAAFLAINSELHPSTQRNAHGRAMGKRNEDHRPMLGIASTIWICQTINWRRHHPHVLDRIETGRLPVIMSFRDTACGRLWDTSTEFFADLTADTYFMDLNKHTR